MPVPPLSPPLTRLVAFDSATERLAVAVAADGRSAVAEEDGGAASSARLLPLLQAQMAQCGLAMGELQAVAFGRGPGAFTGLRTACAVAQGLALGAGCPVLALDSLMLVAEASVPVGEDIELWVAMDARMDEVYAAPYRRCHAEHRGRWQVLAEPALYTLPALAARWRDAPPAAVAGSAVTAFADRLPLAGLRCWPETPDRAGALLRLARAAWADGAARDAQDALPLYLRDKVALTTAERTAARTASQEAA